MSLDSLNPYRLAQICHRKWAPKIKTPRSFHVEVIVVGSVHMGGAGKTPAVIALAESALDRGRKVGICGHGYGRRFSRGPVWVSEGQGPQVSVIDSGDEAWLLASRVPKAIVLCCHSRELAIQLLIERGCDLVICDDGLQDFSIHPARRIVLLPSNPTDRDVRFFPFGTLRHELESLHDVDQIWIEKGDKEVWVSLLKANGISTKSIITFERKWKDFVFQGEHVGETKFKKALGKGPVHLACAIGRPSALVAQWKERMGVPYQMHSYRDHRRIPISALSRWSGPIVMTEKDWVKVAPLVKPESLEIRLGGAPWWTRTWVICDEMVVSDRGLVSS